MDELFGPIIGITLVLMSVFMPAAFLPGLTGRMYAQFALVIAATALLSAINAATLKPTQCAALAAPAGAARAAQFLLSRLQRRLCRGSRTRYARLIGRMVAAQPARWRWSRSRIIARRRSAGLSRVPTGFLPIEDQGYLLVTVQLPDGASLARTQQRSTQVADDRPQGRRASSRSSPSPASRRSTTTPRWPMPASPM